MHRLWNRVPSSKLIPLPDGEPHGKERETAPKMEVCLCTGMFEHLVVGGDRFFSREENRKPLYDLILSAPEWSKPMGARHHMSRTDAYKNSRFAESSTRPH